MNALYNTSTAEVFVDVAKKLQEENHIMPAYWIGFDYDNSEKLVQETFKNCTYQSYRNAWRGIFTDEIEKKSPEYYMDVDFFDKISRFELQALTMMNRMDWDMYSFSLMEREHHFFNLLKKWSAVLDMYNIDIVISATNPHRVYDYVLYLLCKEKGIKFLVLQYTLSMERIYLLDNIYSIGDIFEKDYLNYASLSGLSSNDLPTDILEQYNKVQASYDIARPYYMAQHDKDSKIYTNPIKLAKIYRKHFFSLKTDSTMRKQRHHCLANSKETLIYSIHLKFYQIRRNKEMQKFYDSLTYKPQDNDKYILFPMHYQPEQTTSPSGDIFVNQRLCIETLLANTSKDTLIYVKEHPQQFQNHTLGMTCRIKEFYLDIVKNSRVKLMPMNLDTFYLMNKSIAVATVTGTVGWEAVIHKKPVICFGLIWYEKMPGVLRIKNSATANQIQSFINDYVFDEHLIIAYLMSLSKNSVLAYHYHGRKEFAKISESENVNNICRLLLSKI